jgi:hypothetical protein
MRHHMTLEARQELRDSFKRLYSQSNKAQKNKLLIKAQKNKLLISFVQATGYEREYALKLLSRRLDPEAPL